MSFVEHIERQILDDLDNTRQELYDLLSELIGFDTQNFITHGSEKACAERIRALYEDLGLDTELYAPDSVPGIREHPGYLPGRGLEQRPNVDGVLWGDDRDSRVLVAAHIDTMPVGERASWQHDPFGGVQQDGRIYGLGAGDNKEGIAAGFFAVRALQRAGVRLRKTVVLNSYVDEEYGGGGGALAACLRHPCELIVNLDGGNYELWTAALGGGGYGVKIRRTTPTDTAGPTVEALDLIRRRLEEMGALSRAELAANPLYAGSDMERSAFRLHEFRAGENGSALDIGALRFAIYTDRDREHIDAEFAALSAELAALVEPLGYTATPIEPTTRFFDYGEIPADHPAVRLMQRCAEQTAGREVRVCGACLSDLSVFQRYGCADSFNFGILRDFALPGGAHQPDEFVECEQFLQHTKALALFLLRYCA